MTCSKSAAPSSTEVGGVLLVLLAILHAAEPADGQPRPLTGGWIDLLRAFGIGVWGVPLVLGDSGCDGDPRRGSDA